MATAHFSKDTQEVPSSQIHHGTGRGWGTAQLPKKMDGYAVLSRIILDYKPKNHFRDD